MGSNLSVVMHPFQNFCKTADSEEFICQFLLKVRIKA